MAINIKMQGLDVAFASIDKKVKLFEQDIKEELNEWANGTALRAKQLAPTDEGHLKGAINPDYVTGKELKASVTVAVNYAAYLEFGTKKYAAAYVSSLPSDWQTFASEFKGGGASGGFKEFVKNITEWVARKGIEKSAAYPIALSIIRNGIKQRPYLYPAVMENNKKLVANLKNLFK